MRFVDPSTTIGQEAIGATPIMRDKPQCAELLFMAPDDFLSRVYPDSEWWTFIHRFRRSGTMAFLRHAVATGMPFAPLQLFDYFEHFTERTTFIVRGHEGRNRALYAHEHNITAVPVLIWHDRLRGLNEARTASERIRARNTVRAHWAALFAQYYPQDANV